MWRRKRGRDLFRDYELRVLDLVRSGLDERGAELLDRQIASIEMIQRMFDDQDVLLYPNRRGPQRHDPAIAFPNLAKELRLATVRLAGTTGKGKVVIHVVTGHVFELDFRPSPSRLGERSSIYTTGMTLHLDPMIPDGGSVARRLLASLDRATRAEFEALIAGGNGPLMGADDVYSIHLDDGEYLMLAQLADTSLVVAPIEPARPSVRRLWPDGDPIGDYPHIRAALDDAKIEPTHGGGS
jgi:hypothetical protein